MEILGAPGVGIAILLENLFPPIPSEVVLPLAGFTISQGNLGFWPTFIWATAGSIVGAWALYGIGAWIGAERLRKIADWMWLVEASDVDGALYWFDKYGPASVFFGRFIPGIRSLISIPAGIDRLNPIKFTLWTAIGSAGWNATLIWLGMWLGQSYTRSLTISTSTPPSFMPLLPLRTSWFWSCLSVEAKSARQPPATALQIPSSHSKPMLRSFPLPPASAPLRAPRINTATRYKKLINSAAHSTIFGGCAALCLSLRA